MRGGVIRTKLSALTFMKQLEGQIDWNRRIRSNFDLLFRRIEWRQDWFKLVKFLLISILFVVLTVYVVFNSSIVKNPGVTRTYLKIASGRGRAISVG